MFINIFSKLQTKKGTVLLGAGSQFSETAWTDWNITQELDTLSKMV